jgi:hypothetical protein
MLEVHLLFKWWKRLWTGGRSHTEVHCEADWNVLDV